MKRRDFIRTASTGALCMAVGAGGLLVPAHAAPEFPDVVVVKGAPRAAVDEAVGALGGMGRFVSPGDKVVVKPNMSFPDPAEAGSNTRPEVVAEVVRLCLEAGASSVLVLDNPLSNPTTCMNRSGIRDMVNEINPDSVFAPTSERFYETVSIPGARTLTETDAVRDVLEADKLIACPTAKSHSGAGVSLSLKGMLGLIYNRGRLHRLGLDRSIVDLCSLLKADLTVVDAGYVLTTGGPFGPGDVLKADMVIASPDMVAADAMTVSLFPWYGRKFEPRQVPHIRLAAESGLGSMDLDKLHVLRKEL